MTLRDWISSNLYEDEYGRRTNVDDTASHGAHGLVVTRSDLPKAYVFCAESDAHPFTPTEFEAASREMPNLEFVVVVRRPIANATYTLADELGIAIGGMKNLRSALWRERGIDEYRSKNHQFVQSCLSANRNVIAWRRRGYNAYEVERSPSMRPLIVITINPYEVTEAEVCRVINEHAELDIDAIVCTNPNCSGFSRATLRVVANAGLQIMTFQDFLGSLGEEWVH